MGGGSVSRLGGWSVPTAADRGLRTTLSRLRAVAAAGYSITALTLPCYFVGWGGCDGSGQHEASDIRVGGYRDLGTLADSCC